MKDNLGHRITYVCEQAGRAGTLATGVVVGYSVDGMEVEIRNENPPLTPGEGVKAGELVKFPVGHLVVKQFHGVVELAKAEAAATSVRRSDEAPQGTTALSQAPLQGTEPIAEEAHEALRVNAPRASESTRRKMGNKAPVDHGAAAAGPDEFAPKGAE